MAMKDILNFTFSLTKPTSDNNLSEWNSSDGNKMLGLLADGGAGWLERKAALPRTPYIVGHI